VGVRAPTTSTEVRSHSKKQKLRTGLSWLQLSKNNPISADVSYRNNQGQKEDYFGGHPVVVTSCHVDRPIRRITVMVEIFSMKHYCCQSTVVEIPDYISEQLITTIAESNSGCTNDTERYRAK
jgi:hypothetical protein